MRRKDEDGMWSDPGATPGPALDREVPTDPEVGQSIVRDVLLMVARNAEDSDPVLARGMIRDPTRCRMFLSDETCTCDDSCARDATNHELAVALKSRGLK